MMSHFESTAAKLLVANPATTLLDPSLANIDHGGRSGGQRVLLPIAVTLADLKPIVEE